MKLIQTLLVLAFAFAAIISQAEAFGRDLLKKKTCPKYPVACTYSLYNNAQCSGKADKTVALGDPNGNCNLTPDMDDYKSNTMAYIPHSALGGRPAILGAWFPHSGCSINEAWVQTYIVDSCNYKDGVNWFKIVCTPN